ncbi:Protocadherin Fat 3 [Toxocara canis]|uniref:Protocadherin Fat 3 n=1 Tax=Toxocara canis TaxID=6265 RepID=A0A0B2W313_TOXCA|nr:Protocadherin Fat 3 [Toxocara canis]
MFTIDDHGWIIVDAKLDREIQSACRLNVHVADGGSPALSDSASVIIELEDTNDNVPIFALCNMTAIVQVKADDRGGLSSERPLTVYVKEVSRHSPVIEPLMITLSTLMGEFLGGKIGKVHARDDANQEEMRMLLTLILWLTAFLYANQEEMRMLLTLILWLTAFLCVCPRAEELTSNMEQWARLLGEHIQAMLNDATKQLRIVAVSVQSH